ncbi:YciI family protein [Martelella soudanensis]|uniref:YciI family protein n=1 Tax=unclassified Martelella TaxID=2629616 RepID=UPI0015DE09A9|nr:MULTISPECIES: YciI family protein [unclassified Martelella]
MPQPAHLRMRRSHRCRWPRIRSGFLIFTVPDRAKVEALVAADPFAVAGLIENVTITEWDPLFGAFAAEPSGHLPGLPAPLPMEV